MADTAKQVADVLKWFDIPIDSNEADKGPDISGDKVNYSKDLTNITPGFGVAYSQIVAGNQNVSAKYFLTPKDSHLNLQYSWFNSKSSMGIGYTFRTYDNIRISGPFLNVSLIF